MRTSTKPTSLFDRLEPRSLFATVTFDGGPDGLGTDWTVPQNWAGDVLPGALDDAVIPGPGPAINIGGSVTVRSVSNARELVLSAGALSIAQASTLGARLLMTGGFLGGAGALTLSGGFDWTGGIIRSGGASGRLIVPEGASMRVAGGGDHLIARGITIGGVLEVLSTNVFVDDENGLTVNATFVNLSTGVIRFSGESYLDSTTPGTRSLSNAGRIEKVGAGRSGVGFSMTTPAAGRVDILTGTFGLGLGSTSGVVTVANGARLAISGHTMANGSRIVGEGTADTDQVGGFTATGTVTIAGTLLLNRIDIFGSGTLRIEGAVQADGCILGSTNTLVDASGELLLRGGNGSNILSTRLTNNGRLRLGSSVQVETLTGQNITNSSTGLMVFEGAQVSLFNDLNPGSLPVTNNGEIRSVMGGGTMSARINVTNSASGRVNVESLLLFEGAFSNAGAVALSGTGALLITAGTLSSSGPITIGGGRLEIQGTASLATLQTISGTGGEVRLRSSGIDLLGGTLTLTPGPAWTVRGGTVTNGTIVTVPGVPLIVGSFDSFTVTSALRQILVSGDLSLADPNTILNWQNVTVSGTTTVSGSSASISFDGTQTIAAGRFVLPTTFGAHALRVRAGQTVTAEAGVIIEGRFTIEPEGTTPAPTFINRGTIRSSGGGGNQVNIGNLIFRNEGLLEATASVISVANMQGDAGQLLVSGALGRISLTGTFTHSTTTNVGAGSTLGFAGAWSNTGTVNVDGGRWALGGTFTTVGLGQFTSTPTSFIDITGTLTNTGQILTISPALGTVTLAGGRITGGTVAIVGGATLGINSNNQNKLTDVRVEGDLALSTTGASLRWTGTTVTGTVTLSGTGATIGFEGSQTVSAGTFVLSGASFTTRTLGIVGTATVTLGPGVVIRAGAASVIGGAAFGVSGTRTLVNQGSLLLSTQFGSGGSPQVATTTFTNQGTVESVGLSIAYSGAISNYGAFALTGGTWIARSGGAVLPDSVNVRTLAATIVIDGAGSQAGQLANLSSVSAPLTITGGRTLSVTPNGGALTSAALLTIGAASRLSVNGTLSLGGSSSDPSGVVRMEAAPMVAAGRISATGTVTLRGGLELAFASPPVFGTRFTFISGGSVVGGFATIAVTGLPPGIQAAVEYGPTTTQAFITHVADYDGDGMVTPDDLASFITDFHDPARRQLADFDHDGVVESDDLRDYIAAYFGG